MSLVRQNVSILLLNVMFSSGFDEELEEFVFVYICRVFLDDGDEDGVKESELLRVGKSGESGEHESGCVLIDIERHVDLLELFNLQLFKCPTVLVLRHFTILHCYFHQIYMNLYSFTYHAFQFIYTLIVLYFEVEVIEITIVEFYVHLNLTILYLVIVMVSICIHLVYFFFVYNYV